MEKSGRDLLIIVVRMKIQMKKMILFIYDRPELWETSSESYKHRNKKKDGRIQVCSALFDDFGNKESGEDAVIGN